MAKEPMPSELRMPVVYLREMVRPEGVGVDDWTESSQRWKQIGRGVIKLSAKSGVEAEVAGGVEGIQTYDAWDRWSRQHEDITVRDVVEEDRGRRRFNIRSHVNHDERSRWAFMTLVERTDA